MAEARESSEKHLHETYARLQAALQELVALQRQRSRRAVPANAPALPAASSAASPLSPVAPALLAAPAPPAAPAEVPESRMAAIHHALEQALQDWKHALREMKRLPRMASVATA